MVVCTMYKKKRVDLRFAENVLTAIDKVCNIQQITRTNFIETACREKLNKLRIKPTGKKEVYGKTWEL